MNKYFSRKLKPPFEVKEQYPRDPNAKGYSN